MGAALRHAAHDLGAQELAQQGIHSHCISLDPQANAYVHDIFGQHATVVDRIEQLPERLTLLFVSLTR
jgi:nitric oxide reductase NorD protein